MPLTNQQVASMRRELESENIGCQVQVKVTFCNSRAFAAVSVFFARGGHMVGVGGGGVK